MVNVSVEVRSGAARFRIGVQAQSIQRALNPVGAGYIAGNCRVKFPTEAEGFFVEDPAALAGIVDHEHTQREAA